jgi:small subunit ribosomal protein S21
MVRVVVRKNESPERAMKRFKRKVEKEGIMRDIKRKKFHMKPSARKKLKRKLAAKKRRKIQKRQNQN